MRHGPGEYRVQAADTASVQSAPLYHGQYVLRRPPARPGRDNIYATTRVLRVSNDLTGRKTILNEDVPAAQVPQNDNVYYGTARSDKSKTSGNGTLRSEYVCVY